MEDLLDIIFSELFDEILPEDAAILRELWGQIKAKIRSYEGEEIPPKVLDAIREAIRRLIRAIKIARNRAQLERSLKPELDRIRAEIEVLLKKMKEAKLSEEEEERLKELKRLEADIQARLDRAAQNAKTAQKDVQDAIDQIPLAQPKPKVSNPSRGPSRR